jgi:hypothetical protein
MRILRTLLLGLTGIALGVLSLLEAREFLLSGVAKLPLKRSVTLYAREGNLLAYSLSVALFVVVGVVLCAGAFWVLRGLVRGAAARRQVTSAVLGNVEALAPSGMRPLWVGLVVAVACFAVYAVVA